MNRRRYIATIAAVGTALVAGCSGDDTDNSNNTKDTDTDNSDDGGFVGPRATFDFDYDKSEQNLTITHVSGDTIEASNLYIRGGRGGTSSDVDDTWASIGRAGDIHSGDSVTVDVDNAEWELTVVWESDDGSNSKELASSVGPNA